VFNHGEHLPQSALELRRAKSQPLPHSSRRNFKQTRQKLRRPWFLPRSGHAGFVLSEVTLGQVPSEYFCFNCQSSFHQMLHTHVSAARTIGQLVAEAES
jgi:hypothetical protein